MSQAWGSSFFWLAFLDLDEFLLPSPLGSEANLPEILKGYEAHPAVVVHWLIFGTSGHEETPEGLVIDNYVYRAPRPNAFVKCIAQPSKILSVGAHNHLFVDELVAVNDRHEPILPDWETGNPMDMSFRPTIDVLRVHHYRTKSVQHAMWRFKRDSTFRLNNYDNEDVYPSTVESESLYMRAWDRNDEFDDSATIHSPCVREG
eukprot:CAMPEP_0184315238 /NCGR_PEP_ID=MMETSP1049-20130417/80898_1 /TAXON_ID=77928 /ORGANISM="Proteomonas sulcata, Strain CCMP704" /LENGTH=202 /DNA_ID=CAMNT_0026633599 /DNA_START=255 /DNA_END=861 /DNA_ORIENTATION=+